MKKQEIIDKMKTKKIYENTIRYVEKHIQDAFNLCCRKGLSINQVWPDKIFGTSLNQKTVLTTVRMADLWETAIVDNLREFFENDQDISIERKNDAVGDLIIFYKKQEFMRWEIKTTQSKNSFTGSTHSSGKCNNYILISFGLNMDLVLNKTSNEGIINEIAIFVWNNSEVFWHRHSSTVKSFITFKIPINVDSNICVIGDLIKGRKWCSFRRVRL